MLSPGPEKPAAGRTPNFKFLEDASRRDGLNIGHNLLCTQPRD
jgi:hypothetical protein